MASLKFRRKRKGDVPGQPPPPKEAQEIMDAFVNHYSPEMKGRTIWRKQGRVGAEKSIGANEPSDPRVRDLLNKVARLIGGPPQHYTTADYHVLRDRNGTTYAYVASQREHLKVEVRKDRAEQAAVRDWDGVVPKGWFNDVDVAYFFIPDADENAMKRVADMLARLWVRKADRA